MNAGTNGDVGTVGGPMSTVIHYFSGTGGSLHAARELQQRLTGAELAPVVNQLATYSPTRLPEAIGFVFPIYFMSLPAPVARLVRILYMTRKQYVFAVATRGGTRCLATLQLDRLLRNCGSHLDADWVIDYPFNSPTGLKPGPGMKYWPGQFAPDRLARLEAAAQKQYDEIAATVIARLPNVSGERRSAMNKALAFTMAPLLKANETGTGEIPYIVNKHCNGCGICAWVCLSGKIAMDGGRPVWRKDAPCYYCYACFNCCPRQAIVVAGRYEKREGRYLYPGTAARDIAGQKEYNS